MIKTIRTIKMMNNGKSTRKGRFLLCMNCMIRTIYRFLKAHVEKLFLSRRNNYSYVWTQISPNLTGEQTPCAIKTSQENRPRMRFLRTLVIMVIMVLGATDVWGQTDYSGIYYIRSHGQNADANNIYYLCPTEGWCYYAATNDFTGTSNGMPFLTTFKCKTNGYHLNNSSDAIWTIEKAPNSNYYHIKQTSTGKYLLSNGQIRTAGIDRIRVHLETVADPSALGDEALFEISPYSSNNAYLTFRTVGINETGKHDNADHSLHKYLTVNGGNKNYLTGQSGKTGGPNDSNIGNYANTAGIVGIYTETDANAPFSLEQATIDPPTITNNFDGTITITTEVGADIYYTTDGTTPTTSDYTGTGTTSVSFNLASGVTVIKAIAKSSLDYFATYVRTYTIPQCERPNISVSNSTATITCSTPNASIYYALDDSPATPSTPYGGSFNTGGAEVIRAIATSPGYLQSSVAYYYPSEKVHSSAEITNMNGRYILADDFTSSASIGTADNPFKGFIDGNYNAFTLNGHALIGVAEDAVIKNIAVSKVTYSGSGNVGAIINTAKGSTKLYNSGVLDGSVSGGTNTGGLVGLIESGSSVRVVNCYNFATVSGGTTMAGVVGNNEGTVGNVRIAMCMMYGEMAGTSPVYAGNHESNSRNFTEYNFWRYRSGLTYTTGNFNDQLAIDKDDYLTRFPFYRHILNTHRELAAYFLFANNTTEGNVSDITLEQVAEIGHWVHDKEKADYPIIEPWVKNRTSTPTQTNNNLPSTTADYAGKLLTSMGNGGYLSVSIKIGNNSYSESLPITDMDTLRYDYTYGKVILPFANEYEINENYDIICTGWKITKVGSSESSSVTNYNFADRNNLQKDIYNETTNPFIYAQGGYYIVPTGVSSIEITANFATAIYLSDEAYEIGYDSNYDNRIGLGGSVRSFHGKTIYNSLDEAASHLTNTSTYNPHKQAIVLVGNYHYNLATNALNNYTSRGFTLMSIDADNNQEPDYGFYSIGPERPPMPALRFDFIPIISLGMAAKVKGSNYYPGVPIWKPRGWYEQTETTVSMMNQFELDSGNFSNAENGKGQNPCIINGGYFVQMIRSNKSNCSKVSYYKIGGNAYIKEFYPGAHSNTTNITTTIVPVNVTGGQVEECFMTGYRSGGKAIGSDIRFWCSGGKIGKFLGAYMDTPLENSNSTNQNPGTVNMTAQVDHALIGRFFGGGTSPSATITGDIKVTINNSKVDFYCGGPEFGDMVNGKTVETTAYNTKFGEYYGAGFGGTAITYSPQDSNPNIGPNVAFPSANYTYNSNTDGLKRLTFKAGSGLATCYKFEYLMHSFNKTKLVARFITGYANFSLATTGDVTNNLTGCTVEKDFYGAGCQGKVNGTVSSTLTNCTIKRNAFGGGYKATSNEVKVYPAAAPTFSVYNGERGIFSEFGTTEPKIFNWLQGNGDNPTADDANEKLYTSKNVTLTELGNVTGTIDITIDGGYVGGTATGESTAIAATATTEAIPAGGNVFGGGNESKSLNNATVNLKGDAVVYGSVFGGGNKANVTGSATVNIEN